MEKNESMMIAAAYFWSDTLNAFMFGHGPASPSLANVHMLTGLDISTADDGSLFNRKFDYKVDTRNIGGWTGYVQKYQQTRSVSQREHAIFLNMWLDKFMFYGRSVGPTCVYLTAGESLANGSRFPLGRYLLGCTYHLLHQVTEKLLLGAHQQFGRPLVVHQYVAKCPYAQASAVELLHSAIPMRHR
jgi:hypothetical protein